jgi:6-phosphogluconate dehydrogenase
MKIGLIGLGKMGFNLALNLRDKGFTVIALDESKSVMDKISAEGISAARSIVDLANNLTEEKRIVWLMVPSGKPVETVINQLKEHLRADDIIIDGGNSNYKDSITRAHELQKSGIHFLDCGTSGGVNGARHGVCTMIGGDKNAYQHCERIFKSISVPAGYQYCGKSGSGHFVDDASCCRGNGITSSLR